MVCRVSGRRRDARKLSIGVDHVLQGKLKVVPVAEYDRLEETVPVRTVARSGFCQEVGSLLVAVHHPSRPAGNDPIGRRSPAGEIGEGTFPESNRHHTLYIGRADYRLAL